MASKNTPKTAGKRPGGGSASTAKQRARAAKAVVAAQQARSKRNTRIATASVCVVIVAVIVGAAMFAIYTTNKQKNQAIKAQTITANYPVKIDKGTVLAGRDSAKVKIDIYEDFMCPFCGQLEQSNGKEMEADLNNGSLQIRYRIVDTLNDSSNPAGYSQRAANAAFATVATGKFASYHWSLFHNQPKENGAGYSDDQLLSLGDRLGISGSKYSAFEKNVKNGTYKKYPDTQATKLANDTSLHDANGSYGTPTVVSGGKKVNTEAAGWLTKLVKG